MGEAAALEKDGVEAPPPGAAGRPAAAGAARASGSCGASGRPTSGRSTSCAATSDDEWIAVEIKRIGTIEAVEQLTRYLERIRLDPAMESCRGVLAAQVVKPQARVLAEARGLSWVEVDLEVLRGEREPDLTLFV